MMAIKQPHFANTDCGWASSFLARIISPAHHAVALMVLTLSGCANAPLQVTPPADAWVLSGDWLQKSSFTDIRLTGTSGRSYEIRGADMFNFSTAFSAISKQSGLSPKAGLIASDTPNAFASTGQGGQLVFLSLPMLEKIGKDKDALATTIGHELAHLYLQHGEIRRQRAESARNVSNVLGMVLGFAGIPMSGSIASFGVGTVTSAYSRDEERDADILGLQWAMAAGYSACGSARTMLMLQSNATGSALPFLSSHPGHEERIERANETALKATGHPCPKK